MLLLMLPTTAPQLAEATPATIVFGNTSFQSDFPFGAVVSVDVTPTATIIQAKLYVTMDGITYYTQDALVPPHTPNEPVRIETRWNATTLTRDPSPPWMPLQVWWQITDVNGNSVTSTPYQSVYADNARRAWTATETVHGSIYTYGQSANFINTLVAIVDATIPRLQGSYGFALPYRPALIIYNSASDGDSDIGAASFGSFVVGRAYPGTSGVVMLARQDQAYLQRTITHELAHLFQYQLGPRLFDAPHWFIEGDAKAQEPTASIDRSVSYARNQAYSNGLPQLSVWDSRNYNSEAALDHVLLVGASFVVYLREIYGGQGMVNFYSTWRTSKDFYGSFINTFGLSLDELDAGWKTWLINSGGAVAESEVPSAEIPAVILAAIPEGMARVNAYWLNFRDAPSLESEVVALLSIGQLILPLGRDEAGEWLLVELQDGAQGWLFAEFVDYDGDINALTVSLY